MKAILVFAIICINYSAYANFNFLKDRSIQIFKFDELKDKLNHLFFTSEELPEEIHTDIKKYKIDYSINERLNEYVKALIKRTRSDYAAIVDIDNNTGNILSLIDYDK